VRILRLKVKKLKPVLKRLRRSLPSLRDWLLLAMGAILMVTILQVHKLMTDHQIPLAPEASGVSIRWVPATVQRFKIPIEEMAKKYNIDPDLLAIIMTMESGGDPKAHSEADAQGLMQVTPPTAKDIAAKYLKHPVTNYDLYDPRTNIEFGAAYLAHLRDVFGSSDQAPSWNTTVELIAAGYNGGPGAAANLEKGNGLRGMQTVAYSRDAYNMWRERRAPTSPTFERWVERGGSRMIDKAKTE
jgi:soluble lytic murein transglycosylase-like protein